jgi:hypothetical protein
MESITRRGSSLPGLHHTSDATGRTQYARFEFDKTRLASTSTTNNSSRFFSGQGLTLVHFSAQPEPFLCTDATYAVHFISAQLETLWSTKLHKIAPEK